MPAAICLLTSVPVIFRRVHFLHQVVAHFRYQKKSHNTVRLMRRCAIQYEQKRYFCLIYYLTKRPEVFNKTTRWILADVKGGRNQPPNNKLGEREGESEDDRGIMGRGDTFGGRNRRRRRRGSRIEVE
jgi:hypothetical protein